MTAIFKREFKAYFNTPLGYFVLAVMFFFGGWWFRDHNLYTQSADLRSVFETLFTISMLVVIPILTMRLLADDRRQKTDQALLTAPVRLTGVVLGKFLVALLVYAIAIGITLVYALVISLKVSPDWSRVMASYLGLLLLGGMMIALGLFISALTESQLIAAMVTFAFSFLLMQLNGATRNDFLSKLPFVPNLLSYMNIQSRYVDFSMGLISYSNIIFFLSMQGLFLFFAVRVLDSKRW